jgi:RHS repeat-associated protein
MQKMAVILVTVSATLASAPGLAETVSYYYTNEQGSVLVVTNAAGVASSVVDHRPYGADTFGANGSGPGYTGHFEDEDTSFIYMQARYYDGALGRFLSPDPVTPSNGGVFRMNRYVYGNNNPIANVDPDGRNTNSDGRNTDPCSSAANVCTVDYQSGYGDPSPAPPRSAPDLSYLRTQVVPEDAYLFDPGTGIGAGTFLGPPSERDFNAIDIVAKRDSSNLIGKASVASIN